MSANGMFRTVLATQLATAVKQDDDDGFVYDIGAGLFGPNVTKFIEDTAHALAPDPARPKSYHCNKCGYFGPLRSHPVPLEGLRMCGYHAV